ncbi:hypothetical protein [Ornithinibacillus xuwenensis]|uniref:Phage protein n=1 Tax=Ornithinibacillus xuwenensis TaxID=3144668 RepID=A0ABU9XBY3_9BACI
MSKQYRNHYQELYTKTEAFIKHIEKVTNNDLNNMNHSDYIQALRLKFDLLEKLK